jgi:hypothetical protein
MAWIGNISNCENLNISQQNYSMIFAIIIFIVISAEFKDIKKAVEQLHNCKASHIEDVTVIEKFGDKIVWRGIVHVFKIDGSDKASICYAWSSPIKGSKKRRYYAVLHVPPIDSPEKAVRASIVKDHKAQKI